jgi:ribosomal protein S18 acetylase RimI-like enzyme
MENYTVKQITNEEFAAHWEAHGKAIFDENSQIFRLGEALNEKEKEARTSLFKNMGTPVRINLAAFQGEKLAAWSWGYQTETLRFYMCNSATLPEHRRKGLYTKLMTSMKDRATEMGFQEIFSRHSATNNAVLIPKLKAGFVITSMEVSDLFGVLIHLSFYPNQIRRDMLDYRVGLTKPDMRIKKFLGI